MTTPSVFDFDRAYRGEQPVFGMGNKPPWSIGEPQPEITTLIKQGRVLGDVLDAGCGEAALSLRLAELGYNAVGLDLSPTAIALATAHAAHRGLTDVTFQVADITSFTGYDGRFTTIIDSALFHSTPPALRNAYQQSIARAAAPGSAYFVLTFDRAGFAHGPQNAMKPVTADELHDVVSKYWIVDDIRPARIHLNASESFPGIPGVELRDEGHDRKSAPAWLLTAHLD